MKTYASFIRTKHGLIRIVLASSNGVSFSVVRAFVSQRAAEAFIAKATSRIGK